MEFSYLLVRQIWNMTLTSLKHGAITKALLGTLSMCAWALTLLIEHTDITCSRLAFYLILSRVFLLHALQLTIPRVNQIPESILLLTWKKTRRLWFLSVLAEMEEWFTGLTMKMDSSGSLVTWTSAMAEEKETLTSMFPACSIPTSWAAGALVAVERHSEHLARLTAITTAALRVPSQFLTV